MAQNIDLQTLFLKFLSPDKYVKLLTVKSNPKEKTVWGRVLLLKHAADRDSDWPGGQLKHRPNASEKPSAEKADERPLLRGRWEKANSKQVLKTVSKKVPREGLDGRWTGRRTELECGANQCGDVFPIGRSLSWLLLRAVFCLWFRFL